MAKQFEPIYKGRDFYVPSFQVKVSGKDLPVDVLHDVIEVKYTDSMEKLDSFEITINNWDEELLDFRYTGAGLHVDKQNGSAKKKGLDKLFTPGQEIEIWMGHLKPTEASQRDKDKPEPLRLMMAGIITKLAPTFPASGQPTLKISGQNALIKMMTKQETHDYKAGMKPSEIAEAVGKRGKLTLGNMKIPIRIDKSVLSSETPSAQPTLQNNQYDILFLLILARKNGYDLFLKKEMKNGETEMYLHFGPVAKGAAHYQLEWGKSLVQFQPTLTTMRQVAELTVRSWDVKTKKEIVETVKRSDLKKKVAMTDLDRLHEIEGGFKEKQEIVVDHPFHSKEEARKWAEKQMMKLQQNMITAQGSTFGTPDLHAGRTIEIVRLGSIFDGIYTIKSTSHTIGANGYLTEFEARMELKDE